MTNETRRSPVDALIDSASRSAAELGLHDLSLLQKVGVQGPNVAAWLSERELPWPQSIYALARLDDGALIVRIAENEVVIESADENGLPPKLAEIPALRAAGVYGVEQQTATFRLDGPTAAGVWAQTCGVNIVESAIDRLCYTRVAGVSCGIIPERSGGGRTYRIWVDYGYAPYLWKTLVTISSELL